MTTAQNVTFWTERKVTEKDGDLKICPPVGQIDHKNVKNMDKSLSNVQRLPKISLFEPKKKSTKRIAISKRRRSRRTNYSQIHLATDLEQKIQYVLKMCQNGQNCYFLNQKKVKQKDSEHKISSLIARNVPKLPEMSLFEPRKKWKKRIAISKLGLQ